MSQENRRDDPPIRDRFTHGDTGAAAAELGPAIEISDTDIPESAGGEAQRSGDMSGW